MAEGFLHSSYVTENLQKWSEVVESVARRKGIAPDNAKGMKAIRLQVLLARQEIGFAAKKIIGIEAVQIVDYHIVVSSHPPLDLIKRNHFPGVSVEELRRLVADHVVNGKPAREIEKAVAPYFLRGRLQAALIA